MSPALDSRPGFLSRLQTATSAGRKRQVIQAETACPLCGAVEAFRVAAKDRYGRAMSTVVCIHCGLFRTDPLPSSESSARFHRTQYRQMYKGAASPTARRIYRSARLAIARWKHLAPFMPPACSVLDIGSGSGEWLYVLDRMGRRPEGIEVDPCYADFSVRSYGVSVAKASVFDFDPRGRRFDVITAFHVLEHLADPLAVLRKCHDWLTSDGILAVEVPNLASTRQNPSRLFHPAHLVGFTPGSLHFAAESAGFQPVRWMSDSDQRNLLVCLAKQGNADHPAAPAARTGDPLCGCFRYRWPAIRYWTDPNTYWRATKRLIRMGAEIVMGRAARENPCGLIDRMLERDRHKAASAAR